MQQEIINPVEDLAIVETEKAKEVKIAPNYIVEHIGPNRHQRRAKAAKKRKEKKK